MSRIVILSEYAKCFPCGPGDEGYNAEVEIAEGKKHLYIGAEETTMADGKYFYVSKVSKIDLLNRFDAGEDVDFDIKMVEDHYSLKDTKASKYAKIFAIANRMVGELQKVYGE